MISNQYLFKQIGCHSYLCSYSKMHFYFLLLHALIFCLCGCHEKRDAATAPNVGDRVLYVIIKAAKGAKAYERSEDPIFVLENNIPIDSHYYLENQISKPLLRIFDPILKNAEKELLHGSHTRSVSISIPSNSGIMKFAKKQLCCIGCKALISLAINDDIAENANEYSYVNELEHIINGGANEAFIDHMTVAIGQLRVPGGDSPLAIVGSSNCLDHRMVPAGNLNGSFLRKGDPATRRLMT
ncbi:uncharacterized protein LOC131224137 [Magnolia sinica]|uniref:uncharacterized protein LOC131224137 n=1 Tax=Magnolia sinica TaxID=86752 RepID=UPI00265ADAA7|nr:uncharacterized protein LOC131224137 [Magnolia sinica]